MKHLIIIIAAVFLCLGDGSNASVQARQYAGCPVTLDRHLAQINKRTPNAIVDVFKSTKATAYGVAFNQMPPRSYFLVPVTVVVVKQSSKSTLVGVAYFAADGCVYFSTGMPIKLHEKIIRKAMGVKV